MVSSRQANPLRWALERLAAAGMLGAAAGAGVALWETHVRGLPIRGGVSYTENLLTMALGLGVGAIVVCGLLVVPLALLGFFQRAPQEDLALPHAGLKDEIAAPEQTRLQTPWGQIVSFMTFFAVLGFAGGLLEAALDPLKPPLDNALMLGVGLGLAGAIPGAGWAFVERLIERRGANWKAAVAKARRRLWTWTLAGFLLSALLGGVGMAVVYVLFNNKALEAGDMAQVVGGIGVAGGGLWGIFLGAMASLARTLLRPDNAG